MKRVKLMIAILFVAVVASCTTTGSLMFDYKQVTIDNPLIQAHIVYPYFNSKDKEIADKINKEIATLLVYNDKDKSADVENQILSLEKEIMADTTNRNLQYSFTTTSNVTFYQKMLSVRVNKVDFTGGAHYNYYTTFLNFDKKGNLISNNQLIVHKEEFLEVVRAHYYLLRGITKNTSADEAIMFVEPKDLPLAQNIGIDSSNLLVYYNRYEVTPFYLGSTEVAIPIEEASKFINPEYK